MAAMRFDRLAPDQLVSAQVLGRFLLRMAILSIVAVLGQQGFGQTFE
jgi:hypothetical protein